MSKAEFTKVLFDQTESDLGQIAEVLLSCAGLISWVRRLSLVSIVSIRNYCPAS